MSKRGRVAVVRSRNLLRYKLLYRKRLLWLVQIAAGRERCFYARARATTTLANPLTRWNSVEYSKRVIWGLGNPKTVEARNAKPKSSRRATQPDFAPETEPAD